ncbi:hypothetical protein CISIN_1g034221mg [Citrus sinensis]|uniref:Uncharacterized protein n=1 Tax=Citrus sinensis TaxID=2711 RepID=A0A067D5Y7_CITSI|nr:hypothetical protein CISIN_1g034221mg [Citrus sinensis]
MCPCIFVIGLHGCLHVPMHIRHICCWVLLLVGTCVCSYHHPLLEENPCPQGLVKETADGSLMCLPLFHSQVLSLLQILHVCSLCLRLQGLTTVLLCTYDLQ